MSLRIIQESDRGIIMIKVICGTRKEYQIINHLVSSGLLNTSKEDIKIIKSIVGKELKITYTIKENKKRWWRRFRRKEINL